MKTKKNKPRKGGSQEDKQQLYEDPKHPLKQQGPPGQKTTETEQQESGQSDRQLQQQYGPQKKAQGVKD